MIKPVDYWEEKIQSMPLSAEIRSKLVREIRNEYPSGISESEIMNIMKRNSDFSAFIKAIHKKIYSGQFPQTFSINIIDLFK